MASLTIKAVRTTIDIAGIPVDGLMLPDGSYRVSDTDIAKAISMRPGYTSEFRQSEAFKALPANGLTTSENVIKAHFENRSGASSRVNASTIEFAVAAWLYQAKKGNASAQALIFALATESIERRFDRAFDVKVSEGERDVRLAERFERLAARQAWGDVIKARMIELGYYDDKARVATEFRHLTILSNQFLFGVNHFKCDRDNMNREQQILISGFEQMVGRYAFKLPAATPTELIERVLEVF